MALIYIVEDDPNIREIETIALKNSNYMIEAFENAGIFFEKMSFALPDLVLLDVMLPDMNGLDIIRKLRKDSRTCRLPVIMVTAKASEMDMVRGLDEGADDYIRKPFSVMELLSRVKALLRRTQETKALTFSGIELDYERHTVTVGGSAVELTFKEFELLRCLMINPGMVLTREAIMQFVWGTDFTGESRTVDMHIKTLRQKLGDYGRQIVTIRHVGYVLQAEKETGDEAED